jgi:hypothetical protein
MLVTVLVTVTTLGIRSKKSKILMAHCRFPVRVLQAHILTLNEMHFTRSCPCSCYRAPLVEIQSCASNVRHWKATCFKSTTVVVSVTILSVCRHIFDFSLLGIGTEFTRRDHRPRTNLKKCLRVELVTVYSTTTGSGSTQACQPSRNEICTVVLVLYNFTV